MRLVRRLIVFVLIVAVLAVAGAYLLPREVRVSRSIVIDAPEEQVFSHLNAMQATEAWSPWLEHDPDVRLTYEGPATGVGNKLTWESDNPQVGNGSQEITAIVENERVDTALDFGAMGTAKAYFVLQPEGAGKTRVTWGFVTDLGMNPVARWAGLMMDRWVGGDYEKGLARLKALVEAG